MGDVQTGKPSSRRKPRVWSQFRPRGPGRKSPRPPRGRDWLKLLGGLRDGFLVVASALYVLGYVVWAIYAFQNNLGLLPALEPQYFVAGIAPALALFALSFAFLGLKALRARLPTWFGPDAKGWRLAARKFVLGITVVAFSLLLLGAALILLSIFVPVAAKLAQVVLIASMLILLVVSFFFPGPFFFTPRLSYESPSQAVAPKEGTLQRFAMGLFKRFKTEVVSDLQSRVSTYRRLSTFYVPFAVVLIFAFGLIYFVTEVYPNIPAEFGGPEPRCAQLDVVAAQLSAETRAAVLSPDKINSEDEVVLTEELDVLFAGSEFLLIRPLVPEQDPRSQVYEIRRGVIQAVTWCAQ